MGYGKHHQGTDLNKNLVYPSSQQDHQAHAKIEELLDDNLPIPKLNLKVSSFVIFLFSVSCFWITQYGGFYFDDNSAILNNKDIRSDVPLSQLFSNDFWGTRLLSNASHKSYRPLTVITYRWNRMLCGGLCTKGFHFVNIILYGICSVLLLRVFSIIFGGIEMDNNGNLTFTAPRSSLFCGILFSVHPIHTESVSICWLLFVIATYSIQIFHLIFETCLYSSLKVFHLPS